MTEVRAGDGAIMTCSATDCSYNRGLECFAPSITVGDDHPYCDTYTHGPVRPASWDSFVAKCLITMCDFNRQSRCTARGVTIDCHADHADCATFRT